MVKKAKPTKKLKLTEQEKEQRLHQREIRSLLQNMGYAKVSRVDGKDFIFNGIKSEFDDLYYFKNILLFIEYTTHSKPSEHIKGKESIYKEILNNKIKFIESLMADKKFDNVKESIEKNILNRFTTNQIQVCIVYASKQMLSQEYKSRINITYMDYPIVKYFGVISKVIKKTALYEFHSFLEIENRNIGENIHKSNVDSIDTFDGHILPEEHSSFKKGYKIISFYIDAESLMQRAYVLRNGSWQDREIVSLYQRLLSSSKVSAMRKYLNNEDRVFINNIIATIPVEKIKLYDQNKNIITVDSEGNFSSQCNTKAQPAQISIENDVNIIGIIDGQHRTYAYHEGKDKYEEKISRLRKIQNLLVTGILFPKNETKEDKLKFQAKLFLEINSNQQSASSALRQEIESSLDPFSTTSIAKRILQQLNDSGPLESLFELYWYEKNKIKVTTIISYGLKPIVKIDNSNDTLYAMWSNQDKEKLKQKTDHELLKEYINFCVKELRYIFSALKYSIPPERWVVSKKDTQAVLNLTFINAAINCLRKLIENKKTGTVENYKKNLLGIESFSFRTYKTTHYRKMGSAWYDMFFCK